MKCILIMAWIVEFKYVLRVQVLYTFFLDVSTVCWRHFIVILMVFSLLLSSVSGSLIDDAEESLLVIRRYVAGKLGSVDDVRGLSYLGILAYYVYVGVGDEESIRYLDTAAKRVNEAVKTGDELIIGPWPPEKSYEQFLKHIQALEFLSLHYALRNDPNTRLSMKDLADSLAENLGWRPEISYSRFLSYSLFVRTVLGLTPNEEDLRDIEDELSSRYREFLNYSAQTLHSQLTALTILSHYTVAAKSVEGPLIELEALRMTLENQTLIDLEKRDVREEEYWVDVALIQALIASYLAGGNEEVLGTLRQKIRDVSELWIRGSKIRELPFPKISVYVLDPTIQPEDLFVNEFVWKRDLVFPSNIILLASYIMDVDEEFSSWIRGLVDDVVRQVSEQVASEGYYDVGAGEYVGRLESAALLSSWLALIKGKYKRQGEESPRSPIRLPYTLIASTIIMVSLAIYYKVRIRGGEL